MWGKISGDVGGVKKCGRVQSVPNKTTFFNFAITWQNGASG